ncbi:cytochrome c biogenesis protein CcdA [Candidatus Altiarchaeota archaeon]
MLTDYFTSFTLGLLTPLTAACVLPLYPGFLVYVTNRLSAKSDRRKMLLVGALVNAGIIAFMTVMGLIFTTILSISLTSVIGIVSPIAFTIMIAVSILLILDTDLSRYLPHKSATVTGNPLVSSFMFGFFFGAIVIPCNPGFIAVFFSKSLLFSDPVSSMMNFLAFGIGLGLPLNVISLLSAGKADEMIGFMSRHKKTINRSSGIVMLAISTYYLTTIFNVI